MNWGFFKKYQNESVGKKMSFYFDFRENTVIGNIE